MGAPVAAMAQDAPTGGDIQQWLKVCDPKNPAIVRRDQGLCRRVRSAGACHLHHPARPPIRRSSASASPCRRDSSSRPAFRSASTATRRPPRITWSAGRTDRRARASCASPRRRSTDDFVAALKKGGTLELQLTTGDNKTVPIDFSLTGFTKTFDGPDMGEAALAKQRDETAKMFQEKAQQRGQQLIDAAAQGQVAAADQRLSPIGREARASGPALFAFSSREAPAVSSGRRVRGRRRRRRRAC